MNPSDTPLIRLRGITKVYGEGTTAFQALKGVDLDIARGASPRRSPRTACA